MKALIGDSNQEKALVGAFSVIVKTNGSFETLMMNLYEVSYSHPVDPPELIQRSSVCPGTDTGFLQASDREVPTGPVLETTLLICQEPCLLPALELMKR